MNQPPSPWEIDAVATPQRRLGPVLGGVRKGPEPCALSPNSISMIMVGTMRMNRGKKATGYLISVLRCTFDNKVLTP